MEFHFGDVLVATWAEDFEGFEKFEEKKEARAFASGWARGADKYGAGKGLCYVLPDDVEDMSDEDKATVRAALLEHGLPLTLLGES